MRLMSEELRANRPAAAHRPHLLTGMVLGKYLAALLVYLLGISITLVYAWSSPPLTSPHWPMVLSSFGCSVAGHGHDCHRHVHLLLTQNQVIAAVGGLELLSFSFWWTALAPTLPTRSFGRVGDGASLYQRFQSFALGILSLSGWGSLGVAAIFLFLTIRHV